MLRTNRIEGLDRNTPAKEGMRLILRSTFAELCLKQSVTPGPNRAKGFRELRGVVRRLSYALDSFMPYLFNDELAEFHQAIDQLMNALGEAIDEEGFIKLLVRLQSQVTTEYLPGINYLVEDRRRQLGDLLTALSPMLDLNRMALLRRWFDRALREASRKPTGGDGRSLAEVLREIILLQLKEMQICSLTLYRPSKTKSSHRLRISVRRLSCALDLFGACVGDGASGFQAELNEVQKRLGKLRNLDRNINEVGNWLSEHVPQISGHRDASPEWKAAVWLLGDLFARRPKQFCKALSAGQELLLSGFAQRLLTHCQGYEATPKSGTRDWSLWTSDTTASVVA